MSSSNVLHISALFQPNLNLVEFSFKTPIKITRNLSNESRAYAGRQTDGQIWSRMAFCNYANAHKNLMWQPRRENYKARYQSCWVNEVKKQSLLYYLPLGVLKDFCNCQLHVILSIQTTWSIFRVDSPVTPKRNFWAALNPLNTELNPICQ